MRKIAIISDSLRRDFQAPLKYFKHFEITHLYRQANYNDLKDDEFKKTQKITGFFSTLMALKKHNPDLIAAPEPLQGFSRLTNLSTKILRLWLAAVYYSTTRKKILFFHSLENIPIGQRFGRLQSVIKKIIYWYSKNCQFVFYLNEGAKKNLLSSGVEASKMFHYLWGNWGIDIKEYQPTQKSKTPLILFVGRLEKLKGFDTLVSAFKDLKKQISNLKLWVVGEGSLSKLSDPDIRYFGSVKNSDLPRIFSQAWITCSPSIATKIWAEQIGMVNLQSLACKTPVITTKSGSIPEFITSNVGLLITENSKSELEQAILHLISNQKLINKFASNGRELIVEKYNAKKNIDEIEQFLLKQIQ